MSAHPGPGPVGTAALAAAVVAVAAAILAGGVIMAIAMGGHMDGMMGWGRNVSQTPVLSDAGEAQVEIRDYQFFPEELSVKAGATITWTNRDGVPHNATDRREAWATRNLGQGESESLSFDKPGTYEYFCTIHPGMQATLTVR